jgi:hypothetical protein
MAMQWNGDPVLREIEILLGKRIEACAIHLQNQWKLNVSEPYPPASDPNHSAHMRTGMYRRMIQREMSANKLEGRVGSNYLVSWFLEFGTKTMDPRPGGQITLREEMNAMRRIAIEGRLPAG